MFSHWFYINLQFQLFSLVNLNVCASGGSGEGCACTCRSEALRSPGTSHRQFQMAYVGPGN